MPQKHKSIIALLSKSIDYLIECFDQDPHTPPTLSHLAECAGYTPAHFQKIFQDHVGVSPAKLFGFLRYRHIRDIIDTPDCNSISQAGLDAGLSGTGRLYDLFVTFEAATPQEVKSGGQGLIISYGTHPSPFGDVFLAATTRGLCWLGFESTHEKGSSLDRVRRKWPNATLVKDEHTTRPYADQIYQLYIPFENLNKKPHQKKTKDHTKRVESKIRLHLFGTNFQIQVWQALLRIPAGGTVQYQDIARSINRPKASRAVGTAVGENPVSLLIPCHRVIQSTGIIGHYGWGQSRKKILLGTERFL